jgi:hypothetical protein
MKAIEAQLAQQEDTQISLTDLDARSMQGTAKPKKGHLPPCRYSRVPPCGPTESDRILDIVS